MIMVKDHHDLDRIPMMACTNHTWSCETSILITEHLYLPFQMKLCPQNIKVSCCNQGRQSWWVMHSELHTAGLPPSSQFWGSLSMILPPLVPRCTIGNITRVHHRLYYYQCSLLEILARCTCWTWEVCAVCGQCGGFSQCNDWKTNKYSGGGDCGGQI